MRNPARRERTVTNPATGVASRALQEIAPAGSESDVMTNTDWQDWVGRTESHADVVTTTPVAALAATLDRDDPPPRDGDRCRRCGTGSTSCRWPGNRRSAPTAIRSAAASCRRCRCRAACGRAAGYRSCSRCASASAIERDLAHRRHHAQGGPLGAARLRTRSARDRECARAGDRRGARHRLSRDAGARRTPGHAATCTRRPRRGRRRSDPTTCCCSAIRR